LVRRRGLCDYAETVAEMRAWTDARGPETPDELWVLQHHPVFTQGQAGRVEHLLAPGDIPVIQSDRGGQVTYHGPGQLIVYTLIDLRRRSYGVRGLVSRIERAIVETLAGLGVTAYADPKAPGVYVDQGAVRHKIGSLGLRVRHGCSYHGLSLNVAMDLEPFSRINPCGYAGLPMTQVRNLATADFDAVSDTVVTQLMDQFALPGDGD